MTSSKPKKNTRVRKTSKNSKKIVYRPSDNFFSKFKVNNSDFWPSNWKVID